MRVVIAPDSFSGTLTAVAAAQALADGWRRHSPDDDLDLCPLSDGGQGFVDALSAALDGRLVPIEATGPAGDPALAVVFITSTQSAAYVESSQVCGPDLVPADRRDPLCASSFGLGTLIGAAVADGARRVVVGVGGVVTNDGGAGLLAGLATALEVPGATGLTTRLAHGGAALRGLVAEDLAALNPLRERMAGVELVAATDSDVVLLGFKGVSALHAAAKGATPEQAQELDLALADFARAAVDATGQPQRLVAEAGSGAGGGLGFALLLLGATREIGAALVAGQVGLAGRLAGAGLAVTGEGDLDWQSLHGSVLTAVTRAAQEAAVPTVVVAGQVQVGRRELLSVGVESAYPVARNPAEVAASLADPAAALAARAERVARTWSPRR
ncbi:glycerate kinase [Kineosporia sp. J2-2]|uniref:Glycerate kinase n=1 Tax=Kineosporia corallincola TaxID=2835133 RepID=A0ABS5TIS3_9ACTN|nr:glycerate kinase [Kineosporia corallincola]MBT0771004.1 glycerate kinase [Kineosporia corallincola]